MTHSSNQSLNNGNSIHPCIHTHLAHPLLYNLVIWLPKLINVMIFYENTGSFGKLEDWQHWTRCWNEAEERHTLSSSSQTWRFCSWATHAPACPLPQPKPSLLITYSTVHGLTSRGTAYDMEHFRPTLDLLNENPHFEKIPSWSMCPTE